MNAVAGCCLAAAFLAAAGPAAADIWGFVDEQGVAHIAKHQVDERYYLFKKEFAAQPAPDPATPVQSGSEINRSRRPQLEPLVSAIAREHGLDAALLHAVITVESGYDPRAFSAKGAAGLMQLTPETAERYAVRNVWDPRENLRGGARYLRDLIAMFPADLALALAAYNAGEGAVLQAGNRVPPYPETLTYVPRVLAYYAHYRAQRAW